MLRMNCEPVITIIDLVEICDNLPRGSKFGGQMHDLLNLYINTNLRPRFVPIKMQYNYHNFQKFMPYPSIARQLEYILCG